MSCAPWLHHPRHLFPGQPNRPSSTPLGIDWPSLSSIKTLHLEMRPYHGIYKVQFIVGHKLRTTFHHLIGLPSGYLKPTLEKLSVLHNFTIESQVQLHAPLAFDPTIVTHNNSQSFGLTPEDLTVFVNSAEWTLCMLSFFPFSCCTHVKTASSVSNDPVLHFVVFVPSLLNNPLYILDKKSTPSSSSASLLMLILIQTL